MNFDFLLELKRIKKYILPDRPMPAEQWMILGESDVDGCFEETACRNFKKVDVECGTPKSGQVK